MRSNKASTHKTKFQVIMLVLCMLVMCVNTQGLKMQKLVEIMQQSNKSPFVNLLLVYDSQTQTGKALEEFVPIVTASKKDYYKVNMLDCNTEDEEVIKSFPFCSKEFRTKLPALTFTEPELNPIDPATGEVNQAKQHQYQGKLDQKSLFDFALPLMKAFSSNLRKVKDWEKFTQKNKDTPNILYFTDKEKLPTIYKILTSHFRNTIAFAHVMKDSLLASHFNITKFPTMLLNGKDPITLSKNLTEMIGKFNQFKGQQSNIVIEQYLSTKQELNAQNIGKLVYELPEHILIHINDPSGQMHPEWKKCQQSFKKMFTYYETDHLIKQLNVKQTPAIVYFPKSLAKKQVQKTVFTPKDSFRNIYDEISSLIQDFSVPLANDMEMQKLTSIPLLQEKLIAVLFHQEEISLSYRMLSNDQKFKKDIVFFRMKDPEASVLQKFQIKKLPALYIMVNEPEEGDEKDQQELSQGKVKMNLKIAQYTGKFNYDDLSRYFGMFSKQQKSNEQVGSSNDQRANLIEIDSQKKFKKHCVQSNCYVLLVDGRQSKKESNQNYKNQVKKFAGRVNEEFTVIDAACHSEVIAPLEIQQEQLPTLIYLNSKFEKYTRIIGRVEQKSLNLFISKVKSNKAMYRGYQNLVFDGKKDCEQQHQKLDQYEKGSNSQQALSEDDLQILKEIKEEEQKKRIQMEKMQKQLEKNDKKKRRRRRPKNQEDSELGEL